MPEVVSIRTKNPGAMWPCAIATQFGSVSHEDLHDGNKAAIFPTFEQGAAAQFALWAKNYSGMTLQAAIYKWSGHNSSSEYATFLAQKLGSIRLDTIITRSFLAGFNGRTFMKAQAQWEAGKPYPMTDTQWARAQELAFGAAKILAPPDIEPVPLPKPKASPHVAAGAVVAAGTVAATQASSVTEIVLIAAAVVAVAIVIYWVSHRS